MKSISCNVIVHVTYTDVFFVLLKRYKVVLCRNFYISLRRFVNITALINTLGVNTSYALLSLNEITGCNNVGEFNGISKEFKSFKRFFEIYDNHAKLNKMSLLNFK